MANTKLQIRQGFGQNILDLSVEEVEKTLSIDGYIFLRGFEVDTEKFEGLLERLWVKAMRYGGNRQQSTTSDIIQLVDAGKHAIAPHCEGAYMPFRPDIAAFFCNKPAESGGATLLVDGSLIYKNLSVDTLEILENNRIVYKNRILPRALSRMFCINDEKQIKSKITQIMNRLRNDSMGYYFNMDGELYYEYKTYVIRQVRDKRVYSDSVASFGDIEPSTFSNDSKKTWVSFENDTVFDIRLRKEIEASIQKASVQIIWQPRDVIIFDNWSFLHGRTAFFGDRIIHAAFGYAPWLHPKSEPNYSLDFL